MAAPAPLAVRMTGLRRGMSTTRGKRVLILLAGLAVLALLLIAWRALRVEHQVLLALDPENGRVRWVTDPGADRLGSISIGQGHVIVVLWRRHGEPVRVAAFDTRTGSPSWEYTPPAHAAIANPGVVTDDSSLKASPVVVLDLETGKVVMSTDGSWVSRFGYRPAAAMSGDALVTIRQSELESVQIIEAQRIPDATSLWRAELDMSGEMLLGEDPAVASDGQVTVVNRAGSIEVFDAKGGGLRYSVEAHTSQFRLEEGRLYFIRDGNLLTAVNPPDGRVLWTYPAGPDEPNLIGPEVNRGRVFVSATDGPFKEAVLAALDDANGKVLWQKRLVDRGSGLFRSWLLGPVLVDDNAYVPSSDDEGYMILALAGSDGAERWRFLLSDAPEPSGIAGDRSGIFLVQTVPLWRIWLARLNPAWYQGRGSP
jgi:outer membrane protein assembly factor BamB